jgi:hypothetical protein
MIEKGKLTRPKALKEYELKLEELETKLRDKTSTNSKLFTALQKANDEVKLLKKTSPKDQEALKEKYQKYKKMKQEMYSLKKSMPCRKDFEFINAAVKLATQKVKFIHQNILLAKTQTL